jgi:hypothetical protein
VTALKQRFHTPGADFVMPAGTQVPVPGTAIPLVIIQLTLMGGEC